MKNYERFLMSISQDPLLRSSKLLYDFLATPKETEYKLKMKAYGAIAIPKKISELQSLTGTIYLKSEIIQNNDLWTITTENIQSNMILLKKLNQSYKLLLVEMNQVSSRFTELSSIYNEMALLAGSFNIKNNEKSLFENYDTMKNLLSDFSYFYKRQLIIFEHELKQHNKFVMTEYSVFKELRDGFNTCKNNYIKTKEKLEKKKDDLFKKKDIKKWSLRIEDTQIDPNNKEIAYEKMLPNETHELFEIKQFCCYLGCIFEVEFKRVRKQIEQQNIFTLKEVLNKNRLVQKEFANAWKTLGI